MSDVPARTPKPVSPRHASARRNWTATLSTAKGQVMIKRAAKSAPYAIQQNN